MYPASLAVGVGQDEESATPVRTADFSRCEQARFCAIAQSLKAAGDLGKSQIDVSLDVLNEDRSGLHFADDARDLGPQVPGISLTAPLSGQAKWLAGITGREEMNASAPRSAVEGSQIVPDRCLIQGRVRHPCHESGRSMSFPLDETCSAISGLSDGETKLEAAVSGTERDAVERLGGT